MEDKNILNESVIKEEVDSEIDVVIVKEQTSEEPINIQPRKNKKSFKEKECKVIAYNKRTNTLDVNFDGYGIRIKDVKNFSGDTVIVKYKSEIGKSDFTYQV